MSRWKKASTPSRRSVSSKCRPTTPPAITASLRLVTPSRAYCTAPTSSSPKPSPSRARVCPRGKNSTQNGLFSKFSCLTGFWCFGLRGKIRRNQWEEVGVLAQTPPTKRRPGTFYKVAEGSVTLYGKSYRAVVVYSSSQDQRRQQHLERELQASHATLKAAVCEAARQEYFCHADAEAAAAKLRALPSPYHRVEVRVEAHPKYGPGRPSATQPRVVKALRYGLQITLYERAAVIARKRQETSCFVLLTNVPTAGEMGHRARDVLRAYKEQHGIEQNYGFLKDPLIVNSLFLKKPERIEALGLVLLLALLLWRLVERTLPVHVETTGQRLTGWDKKATQKPTAFMMMTKFAAVLVLKVGPQRQLAQPLSTVQQQYLLALGIPATYFTVPQSG